MAMAVAVIPYTCVTKTNSRAYTLCTLNYSAKKIDQYNREVRRFREYYQQQLTKLN